MSVCGFYVLAEDDKLRKHDEALSLDLATVLVFWFEAEVIWD